MPHDNGSYAAGYNAGTKHGINDGAKFALLRVMEKVNRLGNHSSVMLMKHEIRKEMENAENKKYGRGNISTGVF